MADAGAGDASYVGAFGENLTTRGVLEKDLHIGDRCG